MSDVMDGGAAMCGTRSALIEWILKIDSMPTKIAIYRQFVLPKFRPLCVEFFRIIAGRKMFAHEEFPFSE